MRVFLILQRQLEDLFNKNEVTKTSIQRMNAKEWIPLFEVNGTNGSFTCSLRLQASDNVRTWANLTLLAEWLRDRFAVECCDLLLSDSPPPLSEKKTP